MSVKAAPPMISGALNGPSAVCNMMRGPPSFLVSILDQWKAVLYAGFQQYIKHICNLRISVKATPPMISSALNGPSGCLQYDEGTTKASWSVSDIDGKL